MDLPRGAMSIRCGTWCASTSSTSWAGGRSATSRSGAIDYLMAEVYDFFARELFEAEVLTAQMPAETVSTLDDHLDFERSNLNQPENDGLRAGVHRGHVRPA